MPTQEKNPVNSTATTPLVSVDTSISLISGDAPIGAIAPLPTNLASHTAWVPIATQMAESVAASAAVSDTASGSRQQASHLFSSGLNTLLGIENNPLAQSSLDAGLMGAIA